MSALSFLIPTKVGWGNQNTQPQIAQLVESIRRENIPEYEIIFCGNYCPDDCEFIEYDFDAPGNKNNISRQINLLAKAAKYPTLVYLRDYMVLREKWYQGYEKFGWGWDICMSVIQNADDTRFRDLCAWSDPYYGYTWKQTEKWCGPNGMIHKGRPHLPEYTWNRTQHCYISAAHWCCTKQFMEKYPFDETVLYAQAEDCEWSFRWRNNVKLYMNTYSAVKLLKYKDRVLPAIHPKFATKEYCEKELL
jgi:hypothetical protein